MVAVVAGCVALGLVVLLMIGGIARLAGRGEPYLGLNQSGVTMPPA